MNANEVVWNDSLLSATVALLHHVIFHSSASSAPPLFLSLSPSSSSPAHLLSECMLKKKSTLAHLHAKRLGSSCEQRIEMEMGMGRKSRLRSSNVCTASWLAHQLSRERERERGKGTWMCGWVDDGGAEKRENVGSRVRRQQSED